MINEIIDTIENKDLKEFANELITTIPPYWYKVAASSTGKYHPDYALGEGGLMRHTVALVRLLNHTFDVECMNNWSSRERDMLRIAGLMHDSRKSGSQEDYEINQYTKFKHPLLAAEVVDAYLGSSYIPDEEIKIISDFIRSHMGAFNTSSRSDIVLPLPKTKHQKILHWADYLASRKDIEIKFNNITVAPSSPDTYIFEWGKYKGKTITDVSKDDPSYIKWLRDKSDMGQQEPLKSLLIQL